MRLALPAVLSLLLVSTALAQSIGGNASLSVTSTSANVALPVATSQYPALMIVPSPTTTAEVFYALGGSSVTAATTSPSLPAGGICLANAGASNTYLAAVTAASTATLRITQLSQCPQQMDSAAAAAGAAVTVTQGSQAAASGAWPMYLVQGTTANSATNPIFIDPGTGAVFNVAQSGAWTVNPTTAANWGLGATGAAVPANGGYVAGQARSTEAAAATSGNLAGVTVDLSGKVVTSPYANRENMVRGSASATGTAATTLIAAGAAGVKTYVTDVGCGRTDAGSTAIYVTFSDAASTVFVIPNSGGGGVNNRTLNVPLATAAATAFTFTSSASTSTVYCNAQGFQGY